MNNLMNRLWGAAIDGFKSGWFTFWHPIRAIRSLLKPAPRHYVKKVRDDGTYSLDGGKTWFRK